MQHSFVSRWHIAIMISLRLSSILFYAGLNKCIYAWTVYIFIPNTFLAQKITSFYEHFNYLSFTERMRLLYPTSWLIPQIPSVTPYRGEARSWEILALDPPQAALYSALPRGLASGVELGLTRRCSDEGWKNFQHWLNHLASTHSWIYHLIPFSTKS